MTAIHRTSNQFETPQTVRRDLAAAYRLCHQYGFGDLTDGFGAGRNPDNPDSFFFSTYGTYPSVARASDMEERSLLEPFTKEGLGGVDVDARNFVKSITRHRSDIGGILHMHSPAAMALSATNAEILPISQAGLMFFERLAFLDFEFDLGIESNCDAIANAFAEGKQVCIRNHGLVAGGKDVKHAFLILYRFEQACRVQLDAMASGAELCIVPDARARELSAMFWEDPRGQLDMDGKREWPAVLRHLERTDPDFAA